CFSWTEGVCVDGFYSFPQRPPSSCTPSCWSGAPPPPCGQALCEEPVPACWGRLAARRGQFAPGPVHQPAAAGLRGRAGAADGEGPRADGAPRWPP
ncbi:unnamed protein product, partial [Prorocentrum cordatum]